MSHASHKTAGCWRRGCHIRRQLLVPLCLLALTRFSFLSVSASAVGTTTAEADVAVRHEFISAKEPQAVKEESGLEGPKMEENVILETRFPVTSQKKPGAEQMQWIKAGGLAASAILLLYLFMKMVEKSHAEKHKEEEDRKKGLEIAQDMTHFANALKDLKEDLAEGGDKLAEMNYTVQELIIQVNERLEKIEEFQKGLGEK